MKNLHEVRGDTVAIYINRRDGERLETLIDSSDLDLVASVDGTWGASRSPRSSPYAMASSFDRSAIKPKRKLGVLMHRLIMGVSDSAGRVMNIGHIDHRNHDTLDNRRQNLRIASRTLNAIHRSKPSVRQVRDKWSASITFHGLFIPLGLFPAKTDAVLVYSGALQALEAIEMARGPSGCQEKRESK